MKLIYFIAYHYHRLIRHFHKRKGSWQTKKFEDHNKKMKHYKGLLLMVLLLFVLAKPTVADFVTEEDSTIAVSDKLLNATVIVQNGMKRGTGFYISPTEVITNNHVVADGLMWLTKADGKPCVALVEYTDAKRDLTLIKACESGTPLKLSSTVKLGQSVLTMGNPQSMEFYLSKGIVGSLRVDGYLLHDAVTDHGNSGGAVVNLSGEVVGVSVANFKENSGMSVAITAERVAMFLRDAKGE